MDPLAFDTQTLIAMFGLTGAVIVGGALLAGPTERTGLPALAIFLLFGLLLGPAGLGLVEVALDDPLLRVVATLSLTLVLFTDAMTLDLQEVRRNKALAALLLGPGTLLAAFGLAAIAWALLGLPPVAAIILGAAVASTDPVVLRGMLQGSALPERLRLALRLESGLNDVMLLPIVVIALAFGAAGGVPPGGELAGLLLSLFVLGPVAGVVVGVAAVRLLVSVRERFGVRREYEALYVIGVALAAFAAAEAVGGSGFLAAFAAGLVVSSLDVELCDCFLEYGQVTAEMALLFTYVLLGTAPIWSGLGIVGPATLLFVAVVLLLRLPIFAVALRPFGLSMRERLTLGWFGPRGLGSLLLALLAVFAGLPAGEQVVAVASLAVLVSVAVQGGSPLIARRRRPPPAAAPAPADQPRQADPIMLAPPTLPDRLTIEQLRLRESRGEPTVLIDVRTERSYRASEAMAAGALRVPPDQAVATLKRHGVPPDAWVVAYCT
ncbi:MAG TPA: cation:proton antiporter [Chloroflexaceae bacterium]|nr:cation:proton antiporter [Chloroflexaceae bacterium]